MEDFLPVIALIGVVVMVSLCLGAAALLSDLASLPIACL